MLVSLLLGDNPNSSSIAWQHPKSIINVIDAIKIHTHAIVIPILKSILIQLLNIIYIYMHYVN